MHTDYCYCCITSHTSQQVDADAGVTIKNSLFEDSAAGIAGGSVLGVGSNVLTITNTTFSNSTATCCFAPTTTAATAITTTTTAAGSTCVDVTTNAGGSECCTANYYGDNGKCVECGHNKLLQCHGIGTTVASLTLAAGHWRADLQSLRVYDCNNVSTNDNNQAHSSSSAGMYVWQCSIPIL
jgi:hypothetical protein